MNEWINEKLLPPVLKFVNTKAITALRNGMLYTMPFTIVGSVFLLLANFPVTAISEWVNAIGLAVYFVICGHRYCLLICKKRGI